MQIDRGAMLVMTATGSDPLQALDRAWRQQGYFAHPALPAGYLREAREVRAGVFRPCPPVPAMPCWSQYWPELPRELFAMALQISKAAADLTVLALSQDGEARWRLKAYRDRQVVLKVGADPDDEFPYLIPVSDEPQVFRQFGESLGLPDRSGEEWQTFCHSLLAGKPLQPAALAEILGFPAEPLHFRQARGLQAAAPSRYLLYLHRSSPLLQNA